MCLGSLALFSIAAADGAARPELIVVSGAPGSTARLQENIIL